MQLSGMIFQTLPKESAMGLIMGIIFGIFSGWLAGKI
jgi:hypothetical protein